MAYTVNGFGTSFVRASSGSKHPEYDAVMAGVMLFIPIIPYKCVHVLSTTNAGYSGDQLQYIPLRYHSRIVRKALLRGWTPGLLFLGAILFCIGFAELNSGRDAVLPLFVIGTLAILGGVGTYLLYRMLEKEDERLRAVMGPHELGRSDPDTWPDDIAARVKRELVAHYGIAKLSDLAEWAYDQENYSLAMMCARLLKRKHPQRAGELETQILDAFEAQP